MAIKVNTGAVEQVAVNLAGDNDKIYDDFTTVENAVKSLDSSWESPAGDSVVNLFYQIKDKYRIPRRNVMKIYCNYLLDVVGSGYEIVEQNNEKLAGMFK